MFNFNENASLLDILKEGSRASGRRRKIVAVGVGGVGGVGWVGGIEGQRPKNKGV